tara:strand:- start:69 stop:335 length:267 start_codon:yes stop_codon:yes gene_type:complete
LGSTFFGLTQGDKLAIYTTIHEIVFHGKGGYSWSEVYNMPIWLRKFTFNKLKDWYAEKKEENDQAVKQANRKASKIKKPAYRTRASNK